MAEKTVIANVNDAYAFVGSCDPFKIRKAILKAPLYGDMNVWLIALRGTNSSLDKTDPLSLPVALKSSCGAYNLYFALVKKAILNEIPAGEMLVFTGHSLGGMVCQQLGADKELKERYRILNVMTFGAPYVLFKGRKCTLSRMVETADIICLSCSPAFPGNYFFGNPKHESAGFFFNPLGAHCDSYLSAEVWRKYDCFGIENGGRTLTFED